VQDVVEHRLPSHARGHFEFADQGVEHARECSLRVAACDPVVSIGLRAASVGVSSNVPQESEGRLDPVNRASAIDKQLHRIDLIAL
jgi:hypothetical protein